MNRVHVERWRRVATLVPLAVVCGLTTVAATERSEIPVSSAVGGGGAAQEVDEDAIVVPTLPAQAEDLPSASSSQVTGSDEVVAASHASGIPAIALGAYQRAQTIINGADSTCNITWQLIAAIGRVESDHGRYGGSQLSETGLATPPIYGIPLDGTNNTARILDTDAGELDNDATYDRAVGPMQFIPSTWRVVGVDADRDGVRDPQNINDAALATAVYLCSGNEDLSTEAGKRASVYRYNHSDDYVNLVLAIENAYLQGEYTSVPRSAASPGAGSADGFTAWQRPGTAGTSEQAREPDPMPPAKPRPPAQERTDTARPDGPGQPTGPDPTEPPKPAEPTEPTDPTDPEPTDPGPVELVTTHQQGVELCAVELDDLLVGWTPEERDALLTACAGAVLNTPVADVADLVPDTLEEVLDWLRPNDESAPADPAEPDAPVDDPEAGPSTEPTTQPSTEPSTEPSTQP